MKHEPLIAGSVSLGLGLLLGLGAYFLQEQDTFSIALVAMFAAMGAIAGWVFTWLILKNSPSASQKRMSNTSIEVNWLRRAWSATLLDLIIVAGLGAIAFSLSGVEAPVNAVLASVVAFSLLDSSVRFVLISRKES